MGNEGVIKILPIIEIISDTFTQGGTTYVHLYIIVCVQQSQL